MKFEKPKMETVTFDAEDVIVTSGGGEVCAPDWSTGCSPVGGWDPRKCPSDGNFCFGNN